MGSASVAVIGAGPAGLMAAETLGRAGVSVTVYDRMASPARKFLLAGRGGLNLTHSEAFENFLARYGSAAAALAPALRTFPPAALSAWCEELGEPVFTGTSGRVFPRSFKAAPLLRAWLRRLAGYGVILRPHHAWRGWNANGSLAFDTPEGAQTVTPAATLLALGGASWPRMGSDGGWVDILRAAGIAVAPLQPSNCGVDVPWSAIFAERFAGTPLKRVALSHAGRRVMGEAVVTARGLEGGAVYALSAPLRDAVALGPVTLDIDLRPDLDDEALAARLATPARGRSLGNFLRQEAGLSPVAIGLVQEARRGAGAGRPLASLIRALPVPIRGIAAIERAISSAGGIALQEINEHFMLPAQPGVFVAGEMLDWEAPTGGYLLQACLSTGVAAGLGMLRYCAQPSRDK